MMKPHLFLNNPSGTQKKFDATRAFISEPPAPKPPEAYRPQKNSLALALDSFIVKQEERVAQRSVAIPVHIDYIKIDFLIVFNNNDEYRTRTRFRNQFGLVPVLYDNFNQSVLFALTDPAKFGVFLKLLNDYINSGDDQLPAGRDYAVITLIQNFSFLSTNDILSRAPQNEVIISLIKHDDTIWLAFQNILNSLKSYMFNLKGQNPEFSFDTDGLSTIQAKNISAAELSVIAANYDIIYSIQSLRVPVIRGNLYNQPYLTWGVTIQPPPNQGVIIGVLDNGVRKIAPLQDIIVDMGLDITSIATPNAMQATNPHGTAVASLAALGLEYFDTQRTTFTADAYIVPIKILNFATGNFNIYDIENAIKQAARNGVRIFNLSVCGPSKNYNAAVSEYAYLLDRLSYENDILIFIATGNLEIGDVEAMQATMDETNTSLHTYPGHFYNPNKSSDFHTCEAINLCVPAESFNNISIGAIADNMVRPAVSDLTPFPELPAFYTRKHHLDYARMINGTEFSRAQINYNINKPDIVMPGGDLLNHTAGVQVFGFGIAGNDYYFKTAGTSLASPLAANIAAKILSQYPALNMQSVKALIINSAHLPLSPDFLEELIAEIKNEMAQFKHHKRFEQLAADEQRPIIAQLKSEVLYRRLVGFGLPDINKAVYSDAKSVTLIVQDGINVNSHKVININIPEYLTTFSKTSPVIILKATLCYAFPPVWNNHLGYNPLHISFNFLKSVVKDDPLNTADIIADREHTYFNQFYGEGFDSEKRLKARQEALGIKAKLGSWSEDFYPASNKPFSNTQPLSIKINKHEILKVGNQISVAVRCTYKRDLGDAIGEKLINSQHPFSIVINISEKPNEELAEFDLYNELSLCNTIISAATIELERDLDLEAEA